LNKPEKVLFFSLVAKRISAKSFGEKRKKTELNKNRLLQI
jgi:hypothetical protein